MVEDVHVGDLLSGLEEGEFEQRAASEDISAAADNELVKLVNKIIVDAYQQGASDIHIEPGAGKDKVLVRFRRDGTLYKYIEVPASYRNAMVARIKIMCDLDISEKRRPQDGKIKFRRFGPLDIELRVATIPSAGGVEDVVMRILAAGEPMPLDKLGVRRATSKSSRPASPSPTASSSSAARPAPARRPRCTPCWPTSTRRTPRSGPPKIPSKSPRRACARCRSTARPGSTSPRSCAPSCAPTRTSSWSAKCATSETTAIGIEASLTGHLVFSTLHTNSAPESVVRLLDMGMDPFNFADALLGILAQRLAKRLCAKCKEAYRPTTDEMQHLLDEYCEELHGDLVLPEKPEGRRWRVADSNG